jgi:hypothetical protein
MHFLIAGTLVWNLMETTQKNEVTVYLLCSINYEIKNIQYLRFSFDSPTYMFRATMCPSAGENTVPMQHLIFVIIHG